MSRSLPALAFVLLLAWSAASSAAPATRAPANLLLNPGFEEPIKGHAWMPAAWDTSDTGLETVFFGRDTFLVHGGHYAVSVANTSTLYPVWCNWSQTILVGREAWGKDLVLSVWTRSNGVQGKAYILLQAYRDTIGKMAKVWGIGRDAAGRKLEITKLADPLLDLGWRRVYFSETETDWVRREVRVFVPPSVNVVYVRFGLMGTGQAIFDDASLTLEPAQAVTPAPLATNLLADPGFEGADDNAWEVSLPPYGGQRADLDTTTRHSGRSSIRLKSGDEGWIKARAGVCQVFDGRPLQGKRMRLAGWVKTDSLKELAYLKIYCNTLSQGMVASDPGPTFSMNTDWTATSLEMDVPYDAYEVWAWFAYNAPAKGLVYFDDTSLEVLGPAQSLRPPPRAAAAPRRTAKPAPKPPPKR